MTTSSTKNSYWCHQKGYFQPFSRTKRYWKIIHSLLFEWGYFSMVGFSVQYILSTHLFILFGMLFGFFYTLALTDSTLLSLFKATYLLFFVVLECVTVIGIKKKNLYHFFPSCVTFDTWTPWIIKASNSVTSAAYTDGWKFLRRDVFPCLRRCHLTDG